MRKDKLDFIVFVTKKLQKNKKLSYNQIEKKWRETGGRVKRQEGQKVVREVKEIFDKHKEEKRIYAKNIAYETFTKFNKNIENKKRKQIFNEHSGMRISDKKSKYIDKKIDNIVYDRPNMNYTHEYNYIIEYKWGKFNHNILGETGKDCITITSNHELTYKQIMEEFLYWADISENTKDYNYTIYRNTAKIVKAMKGKYKRGYTKRNGKWEKDKK